MHVRNIRDMNDTRRLQSVPARQCELLHKDRAQLLLVIN